jgi:hypothetical protein
MGVAQSLCKSINNFVDDITDKYFQVNPISVFVACFIYTLVIHPVTDEEKELMKASRACVLGVFVIMLTLSGCLYASCLLIK